MSVSMYQISVPVLVHKLGNLLVILNKAQTFEQEQDLKPDILPSYRLAATMYAFPAQVRIATDVAKGCVKRLGSIDVPTFEDNETTLSELVERVQKTIDVLKVVKPEQIDGTEDKDIELSFPNGPSFQFKGLAYVNHFVLPNFYFHMTTAYNILRHAGVPLGKADYLGTQ